MAIILGGMGDGNSNNSGAKDSTFGRDSFVGKMYDLKIYDKTLTAEEALLSYQAYSDSSLIAAQTDATALSGLEDSLALWLDASNINAQSNAGLSNGDAISTMIDLSGNGYNMTVNQWQSANGCMITRMASRNDVI